jgi:hypothetical protein
MYVLEYTCTMDVRDVFYADNAHHTVSYHWYHGSVPVAPECLYFKSFLRKCWTQHYLKNEKRLETYVRRYSSTMVLEYVLEYVHVYVPWYTCTYSNTNGTRVPVYVLYQVELPVVQMYHHGTTLSQKHVY